MKLVEKHQIKWSWFQKSYSSGVYYKFVVELIKVTSMKSHLNQFKVTLSESKENTNEIGGTQTMKQSYMKEKD